MSATDELKPCPFCGSRAEIVSGFDAEGDGVARIYCTNRHISDSCADMFVQRVNERTARRDVIKMWNRRAYDGVRGTNDGVDECDQLKAENAELRELVRLAWECINTGVSCSDCHLTFGGCTLQTAMRELGVDE